MQNNAVEDRNKLSKNQKEVIGILCIGTFLEFFDLYLYVHMAVLLNELFFPKTDPLTAQLLGATAFCLTYILRPIGGFVIGRIGDYKGRKFTIMFTTFIMACTCVIMAIIPTYVEIGIIASIIVILCRMLQGFSSMGESMGAQVYLAEFLKYPYKSMASGMMGVAAHLGGFFALATASFVLSSGLNWRMVFWAGAVIAAFGVLARRRLRETPEFADYKRRIAIKMEKGKKNVKITKTRDINEEKVNKKTVLAYFFTEFYSPICFYVTYMYLGDFMKELFGMTAKQVINQNLKVAIFVVIWAVIVVYLVKKIHPVTVAIANLLFFLCFFPFIPYWINNISSLTSLFFLRCIIISLCVATSGILDSILLKYLPISKRFTSAAIAYGVAFPLGFVISSFGLIPLKNYFGHYGLWILFTPAIIGYLWSLYYIRNLEIKNGYYYKYPNIDATNERKKYRYSLPAQYKGYDVKCKYSRNLLFKLHAMNKYHEEKVDIKLIKKAIIFTKKWHGKQKRKTGEPYYSHPLAVAAMVSDYSFKTNLIVAAILHDVVEDSRCSVKLIKKEFNLKIATIVERLTRRFDGTKISIREVINKLFDTTDYEALLIKGLDRLHNLQTIHGMTKLKQREIAIETIYEIADTAAYAVDKLNINNKLDLEEKLFSHSYDIVAKNIIIKNVQRSNKI